MIDFGNLIKSGKDLAGKAADTAGKAASAAAGAAVAAGEAIAESPVGEAASAAAGAAVAAGETIAESPVGEAASATMGKAAELVGQGAEAVSQSPVGDVAQAAASKAGELAEQGAQLLGINASDEPDEYDLAIIDYNAVYTAMNDAGMQLYRQRERSVDIIGLVEHLVNSIANTPQEFKTDFEEIEVERKVFSESQDFAREKLQAARDTAGGAGTGVATGIAVASMAPTAALWVATTFGTASTGAAISTLSGAAATKAAIAWLGGGAIAAGGGGMAAGNALLAMAGPVGWTIAGASVLTSVVLFTKRKHDIAERRQEELTAVKRNTGDLRETEATISALLSKTSSLREGLAQRLMDGMAFYQADYRALGPDDRHALGAIVNNTRSLAHLLNERVDVAPKSEEQ